MTISPYLYFNGNCAEAFEFYKTVFSGNYLSRETYNNLPAEYGSKPEDADKIMHVTLNLGEGVLMGADMAGDFGPAPVPNGAVALSYAPKSKEDADRVFQALSSEGGEITMAMQETFWGSYFGTCTDRFGSRWLINLDLNASA